MNGKLSGWDDTIIALATPPGVGAIGLLRISGKKAVEVTNALFPSKDLAKQKTHTIHVGLIKAGEEVLDEAVVSLFFGPKSYTGEDVVEIGCHGSPYIHQRIIDAFVERGVRLAKPGEFTQRAFLNGKLDLTQAEAVADVIASNTEASHKTALKNIRGGFSNELKTLREELLSFSALIELELDFSQEDVEFADRTKLYELIRTSGEKVDRLLKSFKLGNVIKNGVSIVIAGKPNAGKSTLLNALLEEDRAIVSDIPGTTRDTIEETMNIDGILFRLIDTAGIREHTSDIIEEIGVGRSLEKIKQADLVLYLIDATEMLEEVQPVISDLKQRKVKFIPVINKVDKADEPEVRNRFATIEATVFISAKQKSHLELLKERMVDAVISGGIQLENTIITNARHYHALAEISKSLTDIKEGMDNRIAGDLLALDIRRCLHYLGEITGEITNEDQLDYIFSKFCIGK